MSSYRNIVIINPESVSGIVMSGFIGAALKKSSGGAKITLLTTNELAGLARLVPEVDEVLIFKEKDYSGMLGVSRLGDFLKTHKFDMAFCLKEGKRYAMAAFLAGIPERVGYDTEHAGWFLTKKLAAKDMAVSLPERYQALLKLVGISADKVVPELALSGEVKEKYFQIQEKYGLASNGYLVIAPLGSYGEKSLSQATASHLARHWHEAGRRVYLIGSFEQGEILETVARFAGIPYTQVLAGKLTLPELAVFLQRSEHLITVDIGPWYIAQAVGCPSTAVFGPTLPPEGKLANRNTRVLFKKQDCAPCNGKGLCKYAECLGNITALEIIRAVEE